MANARLSAVRAREYVLEIAIDSPDEDERFGLRVFGRDCCEQGVRAVGLANPQVPGRERERRLGVLRSDVSYLVELLRRFVLPARCDERLGERQTNLDVTRRRGRHLCQKAKRFSGLTGLELDHGERLQSRTVIDCCRRRPLECAAGIGPAPIAGVDSARIIQPCWSAVR